ncbi:MAG TPA: ABC transporter substrate-binding protein [bacterium]|nr:ABC transporter substrate-binding protein [bacterium]
MSSAVVVVLIACSIGATTAPRPTAAASPPTPSASGGTLVFGLSLEPPSLDPQVDSGTAALTVKLQLYRGLVAFYNGGKIVPELAESWKQESPTSWVFNLRRGTKFSNGDPVTTDDVVYSFQRILDPKTGARFRTQLSAIDKVEAVGPSTVRFTLKQPVATFLELLALPEQAIVDQKFTQTHDLKTDVMGAGPFKMVEWQKGVSLTVERVPGFYKEGLPKLDRIKFVFLPDDTARVTALRAGDVDLIEFVPWKDMQSLSADPNFWYQGTMGLFMYLQINVAHKPFDDPRVRQALGYAINRQAILDAAFSGRGGLIYGMATPSASWAYIPADAKYFRYDPDKARALLRQAGVPDGLKVNVLSTSTYMMHEQTAVVVQAELKKVGLDVELNLPDWPTRLEQGLKGNYDLAVAGNPGDFNDPDFYYDFYHTGPIRSTASPNFSDGQIDRLLEEARQAPDLSKRKQLYAQFETRALELSPLIFLTWREQGYAGKKSVRGFQNLPAFLVIRSGITLEETTVK